MKHFSPKHLLLVATLIATLTASSIAQGNIIVGDLYNLSSYGSSGGIAAFSVGTTSCNTGNQPVPWVSSTNNHPVIGLNMYRLMDGKMEQIGMSWLKHGFLALSGSVCTPCNGPGGSQLSPGCSDPYSASLNGSQSGLGPRGEVNASTGVFPYPPASPSYPSTIGRRLQVDNDDLNSSMNPGARYFVEGHYISQYDSSVNNDEDNASYREIDVSGSGNNYNISFTNNADTVREKAAIEAWADIDPGVEMTFVDVPGDGRFIVGYKVTPLGNGNYHWEFAVHNLNSHDSARSFTVPLPSGASVFNVDFHGIDHHSNDGENGGVYSGANWTSSVTSSSVSWQTSTHSQNPLANALRWGTLYNFRFDSNMAPAGIVNATIGLYRSGGSAIASFIPQATVTKLSGDSQGGNVGQPFLTPLKVRVAAGSTPIVGVPVTFAVASGNGNIIGNPVVMTDSNGDAQVSVSGGAMSGAWSVTATSGSGSATFNLFTRQLRTIWSGASGLLIIIWNTEYSNMPVLLSLDDPMPAPGFIPTPYGNLYTNLINPVPGSTLYFDGLGVFGPPVAGYITNAMGGMTKIYTGLSVLNGTGLTKVFQCVALPGYVLLSNPATQTF